MDGALEDRADHAEVRAHRDSRGTVFEPLDASENPSAWRNVHVVITEPGAVRGNHRHPLGTEILAVAGPALVRYRDAHCSAAVDVRVPASRVYRFRFPPDTAHAFKNTGTAPSVAVAFNTMKHDPAAPDVLRDELISA